MKYRERYIVYYKLQGSPFWKGSTAVHHSYAKRMRLRSTLRRQRNKSHAAEQALCVEHIRQTIAFFNTRWMQIKIPKPISILVQLILQLALKISQFCDKRLQRKEQSVAPPTITNYLWWHESS